MYRIVVDSCGELTPEMIVDTDHFASVPLTISVGGKEYADDENFDQGKLIAAMAASSEAPHSACPSPAAYMEKMQEVEADHYYAVTLSSQLSGSYNAAVLAGNLMREEWEDDEVEGKYYHAFNSKSASIGETLIAMKIAECEEAGMSFEEVVDTVETYIEIQHTYFLLESLDMLEKAGRLGHLAAKLINTLNIKPVMGSTPEGNIQRLGQARGMKAAIGKMAEFMRANVEFPDERTLMISHCAAPDRAEYLKEKVLETGAFKDVIILETRGISTMYAGPGGLIMVV